MCVEPTFIYVFALQLFITFTRVRKPTLKRLRFHNPVYRKTTEDEMDDGRGFTIAQEQLFYNPTREYGQTDSRLTQTEEVSNAHLRHTPVV